MPILLNLVKSNRFEINHLSRLRTRWGDREKAEEEEDESVLFKPI